MLSDSPIGLLPGDPRRFGRYRVRGRLGAGGMGVVFLAVGPDGRRVAIKSIRADLAGDEQFRLRFRRELEAASRVNARFTAQVLDHSLDSKAPYFVTEYVPGPDLAAAVRSNGPLGRAPLLGLSVGLGDALVSIHEAGLVHRDVKPSNVLLASDGPRLVDFGIAYASELTDLTRTGVMTGSPAWMAPEQAVGRTTDSSADVFGWGATVAFAGLGRAPFGEGRADAVLYRVVHDEPDLEGLPEPLRALVARALQKRPTDRPSAQELLRAGLQAVGGGDTTLEVRPAVDRTWVLPAWQKEPLPPPRSRGLRRVVVPVVILVLISAGLLVATLLNPETPSATERDAAGRATNSTNRTISSAGSVPTVATAPAGNSPIRGFTFDGSLPTEQPKGKDSVGSIQIGMSISALERLFGRADEVTEPEDMDPPYAVWEFPGGGFLRAGVADDGTALDLNSYLPASAPVRASLAEGIFLGATRESDLPAIWQDADYRTGPDPASESFSKGSGVKSVLSYVFCVSDDYSDIREFGMDNSGVVVSFHAYSADGVASGC